MTCGISAIGVSFEESIIVVAVSVSIAAAVVVLVAAREALEQAAQAGGSTVVLHTIAVALLAVAVKEVAQGIKHQVASGDRARPVPSLAGAKV